MSETRGGEIMTAREGGRWGQLVMGPGERQRQLEISAHGSNLHPKDAAIIWGTCPSSPAGHTEARRG